jgi:hypothetical protein
VKPGAYIIDDSRSPLVTGRAGPLIRDESALEESYRRLEQLLARQQPVIVLLDLRGAVSSPGRRKRFAEWLAHHEAEVVRQVLAIAVVVGNELERGFVTAVAWLKASPVPLRVFTDPVAAEQWLRERYEARYVR